MHNVIVCMGSNVPQRHDEIRMAVKWLTSVLENPRHTSPYLTSPEGENAGISDYLNAVMIGETALSREEIESAFKQYEIGQGRLPVHKKSGRIIIDIDLVCYDDEIIRNDEFETAYFQAGYRQLNLK